MIQCHQRSSIGPIYFWILFSWISWIFLQIWIEILIYIPVNESFTKGSGTFLDHFFSLDLNGGWILFWIGCDLCRSPLLGHPRVATKGVTKKGFLATRRARGGRTSPSWTTRTPARRRCSTRADSGCAGRPRCGRSSTSSSASCRSGEEGKQKCPTIERRGRGADITVLSKCPAKTASVISASWQSILGHFSATSGQLFAKYRALKMKQRVTLSLVIMIMTLFSLSCESAQP